MELMETNKEIDDIEEKYIYKNALKRIMDLDVEMHDSVIGIGYMTGAEGSKYFSKAIAIARKAISEGAMRHVKKYE